MENKNRKYEYVIGIDFGHGETSAAICALDWDTPVDQLDNAKDLEMGGNSKVIPSAITILANGDAKIGDAAFNPDVLKKAKVNVCFKQAPKDINGVKENLMIRYMQEVYKRIRENNTGMLNDGNHLVYIATPSGWDKPTQALYVEMAKKAGLPIPQNGVTKESRAAFVRAQHDTTSGIGRNIEKGAIVFDMGSSTLDFTYMNRELPNLIDNGYDCGASHVEKAMFARNEEENEAVKRFEQKYPDLKDFLLFEARKVKEQIYFDPSLRVKKTINFDDFIDDEDFEDDRYKLSYQPGELDRFLEEIGYTGQIEEAMKDYKTRFIPGQNIYGVFLTGGASRMDFIKDLVTRCWGVPKDLIYRDQDPSLTISQGVAEVARMDLRTESMDTTIAQDIEALKNSTTVYDNFVDMFGGNLYNKVTEGLAEVINDFADGYTDMSVNQLQSRISNKVNSVINAETANAEDWIEAAIMESARPITEKVEDLIKHYSQQGMNLQITTEKVSVPKIQGIGLESVIDQISATIQAQSGGWGEVAAGFAIGAAAAWLLGPIGWAAIAAYTIFGGKSEEEKKKEALAKKLNSEQRGQVRDAIAEKWDEMIQGIANSITTAIDNRQLKQAIKNATGKLLEEYKDNLQKARLLID